MRSFRYIARERGGRTVKGILQANNKRAAAQALLKQGLLVTKIIEGGSAFQTGWDQLMELIGPPLVTVKSLAILCRNFATMINAGLGISTVLDILIDQTSNKHLKAALAEVRIKVQEGEPLSKSLAMFPRVFPDIMIAMVESGETGGILEASLDRLAMQLEKDYKIRNKVKSALIYPAVVLSIAICAMLFIMIFVFPTFMQMFAGMNMELPLITKIMVFISDTLRLQGGYVFLVFLLLIGGGMWFFRRPQNRSMLDIMLFRVPIFGELARKAIVARFCRTLASLLRGGVPIIAALDVVKKVVGNFVFGRAVSFAQDSLQQGKGLSKPLKDSPIFPVMVVQMISVGEEAGTLDKMLDKAADFYESEVDDMVAVLSSLLEPVLLVFIGASVGTMVVSVILPMFQLLGGLGK